MCHVPVKLGENDAMCLLWQCKPQIKHLNRPNDNREEPRSTPRDLQIRRTGNAGNKSHVSNQNKDSCHQARFDERYNRQ